MKRDSEYYLRKYCETKASELKSLKDAIKFVAENENFWLEDVLMYYCKMHEQDKDFQSQVNALSFAQAHTLLVNLSVTDYNIFVPWVKKLLFEIINDKNHKYSNQWAIDYYSYYKKSFDNVHIVHQCKECKFYHIGSDGEEYCSGGIVGALLDVKGHTAEGDCQCDLFKEEITHA